MITTGIEKRVQVQQIIDSQLPEFVVSENPNALEFFKQYYISQEYRGGPVDLSDNLDQYLKLDNLTPEVIRGSTSLSAGITTASGTISVDSTKGFPNEYGLIKIDDEIITYTGVTTNTFTGCVRGFSGITTYHAPNDPGELVFSTSSAGIHTSGSNVQNLSALFLNEFYKKIKTSLTPGLEDTDFVSNLDVSNFIKESKSLYQSKGTEESFRILFNVLYGVDPKIVDLEELLVKPSSAEYVRREVILAERISGDPNKLIGQTITKSTDADTQASVSEVEIVTRDNRSYYKMSLFVGYDDLETIQGTFTIPGKTKVIGNVSAGSSVITVDSTVGFTTTGTVISGINTVTYDGKTINQFLNCSGVTNTINTADDIRSDEVIFGYENGDSSKKVELRITGVISKFVPITTINLTSEGEQIIVKNLGEEIQNPSTNRTKKQILSNSWVYNTSCRFQIDSISGSTFVLKSDFDKSNLKEGDTVEILRRNTQIVDVSDAVVTTISATATTKQLTLNNIGGFTPTFGIEYDLRRKLEKVSSTFSPIQYGNNVLNANVQNVYNELDKNIYVASSSLPSYNIDTTVSKSVLADASGSAIQGFNSLTTKYSVISFTTDVPFITGDALFYRPQSTPITGLSEGLYYVEVLTNKNQIRLYNSPSFIPSAGFVEFEPLPSGSGSHTFVLLRHRNEEIGVQKTLKKFPIEPNIKSGKAVETATGTIGMLVNGVEISNYKSDDRVYYGPLSEFKILNQGTNFDVIDLPQITMSSPGTGTTALVQPVISGNVKEILVDQQNFDIEKVISITIDGGNGSGAILQPVINKRFRELEFSGRTTIILGGTAPQSGGIDTANDQLIFNQPHNLHNGQALVYNNNNNASIGVGSFAGPNTDQNKTLSNGSIYYPEVVGINSIRLYETLKDYNAGINTVGFTTTNTQGTHKFRLYEGKNHLQSVRVINPGSNYTNRKLIVKTTGISTVTSSIKFNGHGFEHGEVINYRTSSGVGTITGLNETDQYKVIKLDNNSFRLANAGVGGTNTFDFDRGDYVKFETVGSGNQEFSYPPVQLTVTAVYSPTTLSRSGDLVVTPIVRGSLVDAYLYETGTNYGSEIVNFEKKPTITIKNGKRAELKAIVSGGKILSVDVRDSGTEYFSPPDLEVVGLGTGVGARLRPIVSNGQITEVKVVNAGIGYSESPSIKITPAGRGTILEPSVRSLRVNNFERFGDEFLLTESIGNLKYSVVGYSTAVGFSQFNDTGTTHSPIIGWAFDGNPVYGPYGFSDPSDSNSSVRLVVTGYEAQTSQVANRPSSFSSGFFVEDYQYTGRGDLDQHNGRFCKTPEYPDGVYAYFVGVNTGSQGNLEPEFPYFVGNTYRSTPEPDNFLITQDNFDFNSSNIIRNTLPYKVSDATADNDFIIESNELTKQVSVVESVTRGTIDDFQVVESGSGYKVGDSLVFDNTNTSGGGAAAIVRTVTGKTVSSVNTTVETDTGVVFVRNSDKEVAGYIGTSHNFVNNDNIVISGLSSSIFGLTKSHKIGVSSEQVVLYNQIAANATSGIVTDIYVSSVPSSVSVGSSIGIGTERFKVLDVLGERGILRVKRGVAGAAHTISTPVFTVPQFFTIPVKTKFFDSKVNDVRFFNPTEAVGVGTIVGISSLNTITVGEISDTVSVPAKNIYLPGHNFKTNQRVLFTKPSAANAISVGLGTTAWVGGSALSLPASGDTQEVFIVAKSKDYIGIALTANTDPIFFVNNGSDNFEYKLESRFAQITGKAQKITSHVAVSTAHGLSNGDKVTFDLDSDKSIGVGNSTQVVVRYNSEKDKVLINPIGFNSTSVSTSANTISLTDHGLVTGDKVFYESNEVITGLSTGSFFVYRVDDDTIQLTETLIDARQNIPVTVSLGSTGGSDQKLSRINPELKVVRDNDLVFNVSDSTLSGYEFKLYFDENFNNDFVSTGTTSTFVTVGMGTVGVGTTSVFRLNYSEHNPESLFYTIEKSGFISTSDVDVVNRSRVTYVDSTYNGTFDVFGVGTTSFNVSLRGVPESLSYTATNTSTLKYTTNSTTADGGVEKLTITSPGLGYKQIPGITSVTSASGVNAKILAKSKTINQIDDVRILDPGFEYPSDKTLRPEAQISPTITTIDSDVIKSIEVLSGGRNYTTKPDVVVVNPETGLLTDQGVLEVELVGTSIDSVKVEASPKGLSAIEQNIRTINNSNGIAISSIVGMSTINTTGIVTCTLVTPISGFTTSVFEVGEKIFVEGIERIDNLGTGYNSPDNGFEFYTVSSYANSNPAVVEFNLTGISTNPGVAKTSQNSYASIVKFADYPQFKTIQGSSEFKIGERLAVLVNNNYILTDLVVTVSDDEFIKVQGLYDIFVGDKIKGEISGTIATLNTITANTGRFDIDFSLKTNRGWSDSVGKLDVDHQVLPDNDYYQNLSYTIQSPVTFDNLVDPVNRLLHTSGLKNFADTGITSTAKSGISTSSVMILARDLITDKRVDTINNFDLAVDTDTAANNTKSKFIRFKNKKLASYIECRTNRVLQIDDISNEFSNNNATLNGTVSVPVSEDFARFFVQSRNPANNEIQVNEIIVFKDSTDTFTFEKFNLNTSATKIVDISASTDTNNNTSLVFTPTDIFNDDLDIKVYKNSFNTDLVGINTNTIGFVNLVGANAVVSSGTTVSIVSSSSNKTDAFYAALEVTDTVTDEKNYVDVYVTHDGTDSYFTDAYVDSAIHPNFSSNFIGTITSNLNSGVLSLNFENDTNNSVLVRSRTVGFGTTAAGIGTHRFKDADQVAGSERSLILEADFSNVSSASTIVGFSSETVSTINSFVRVSAGDTSSLHRVVVTHDDTSTHITQFPYLSIGSTSGIGTFTSEYHNSNLNLVFNPDSNFSGNIQVQAYSEVLYKDIDLFNVPPNLQYGTVKESVEVAQYNAINGNRSNKTAFDLKHDGVPIFAKTFAPTNTTTLNAATGVFTITDHFFKTGEKLKYTPESTFVGVAATAMTTAHNTNLPTDVFAIRLTKDTFKLATSASNANAGTAVTFASLGAGNAHKLEMDKKLEKSVVVLDGLIQSPLAFTPLTLTVSNNVGGQISSTASVFSVSGISSIQPTDVLKIGNEFLHVTNVGLGTTSVGPISGSGSINLIQTKRAFVGTSATSYADGTTIRKFAGSFNIVGSKIHFTDAPRGTNNTTKNISNRDFPRSDFSGRVYLRNDYSDNRIFDDISDQFTGIGTNFNVSVAGVNTTGIDTGSSIVLINGIFQKPTTANNADNNYEFEESGGATDIVFTGITSTDGTKIVSTTDANLNQLPRGGMTVSFGSTGGLGIAPLVGAAITATLNGSGAITGITTAIPTGSFGSGYRGSVSIGITDSAHTGTAANVTATVGAGGTLSFNVVSGGSGYVNPIFEIPEPSYTNLEVVGVSRLGIGATTDTGNGLLVSVDVGASSTTGIGSTLFTVTSFKIDRPGFGFKVGDVIKPVGLVTDRSVPNLVDDFELTITDVFTDKFASWDFGEFDYIDPITNLQNGTRTRFPLKLNGNLLSFEIDRNSADSSLIDMQSLLLIFINGVIQVPGEAYTFDGGATFAFTTAPDPEDEVSIFFYKGTTGTDSVVVDVTPSVKSGDDVRLMNNSRVSSTLAQEKRVIAGITTSDTFETDIYTLQGIDDVNFRPLNWTKQKIDKKIAGEVVSKSRDSIESLVFPTARIIADVSTTDNEIFVDDASFFNYEEDNSNVVINSVGALIIDKTEPVSATFTAVVSAAGTVSSVTVNSGGTGYVGSTTSLSISQPTAYTGVGLTVGVGTTARALATANIANGSVTSVTITRPGFGYTTTNVPLVIAPFPEPIEESLTNINGVQGFSGIVTGITTTTIGVSTLGMRIGLEKESGNFNDLVVGHPIYVYDTTIGAGVTSLNLSGNDNDTVGIGSTFIDNVYMIKSITRNGHKAEIVANVHSATTNIGIGTTGNNIGKFSWGRLFNSGGLTRNNPISIGVTGNHISGLSTFPTIQRRGFGIRNTGALRKQLE